MAILGKKQKGVIGGNEINSFAYVNLFVAISSASATTIWALYINSFVKNTALTGFISGFLTLISFISYFAFIPLIEKSDKGKLFMHSLIIFAISYLLLTINKSFIAFLLIAAAITITATIRIAAYGIIVKDKSKKHELAKNEGLLFTFLNIGWLLGPLIAGYLATKFGLNFIFIISALLTITAALIFKRSKIEDKHIKRKIDTNMLKNFIDFFKNKTRTLAYIIDGGSTFWWVLIYLFIPLLIVKTGLSIRWVGYFLFAITIPLISTEYILTKFVEKYGFKKIFKMGFLIPAIAALLCFLITNIYVILIILVLASFGMALLEPTTEAHFLSIVNNKEISRFYGPYSTTRDLFQLAGKILSSLILIILPFKFVFLLFSLTMFTMLIITNKIEDNS